MKRQITQFDNDRTNATVATPTCSSSCCCCCCCLTTTFASSTILARRINKEARDKRVSDPVGLTVLAALFLPVIGLLTYLMVFFVNNNLGRCIQMTSRNNYGYTSTYLRCTDPANSPFIAVPIAIIVAVAVLSYLYMRVKMQNPVLRASVVTVVVTVAFVAEGIAGALLILTGIGGIVYLCLIPILFSAIQRLYSRKILHQTIIGNKVV